MREDFSNSTKVVMQLYYSRLSEKDRRQYAALESMKLGHGGISYISEVLCVDRKTIIQGRKELNTALAQPVIAKGRQRKEGGGRKKNDKPS